MLKQGGTFGGCGGTSETCQNILAITLLRSSRLIPHSPLSKSTSLKGNLSRSNPSKPQTFSTDQAQVLQWIYWKTKTNSQKLNNFFLLLIIITISPAFHLDGLDRIPSRIWIGLGYHARKLGLAWVPIYQTKVHIILCRKSVHFLSPH